MNHDNLTLKAVKWDTLRIFVVVFGLGLILTYVFSYFNMSNASTVYLGSADYAFQFWGIICFFVLIGYLLERLYARKRYPEFLADERNKRRFELVTTIQALGTIVVLTAGLLIITNVLP